MPKYSPEREQIEAQKLSKTFLENGLNAAEVARKRGTTRQNEAQKIRRKPVKDCIKKTLSSSEFQAQWLKAFLEGAFEADKSIQAVILVDKDGKIIKADDHGGIMTPDWNVRYKYLHDLGIAIGILSKPNINIDQQFQLGNNLNFQLDIKALKELLKDGYKFQSESISDKIFNDR